jgi:hypothetical protein
MEGEARGLEACALEAKSGVLAERRFVDTGARLNAPMVTPPLDSSPPLVKSGQGAGWLQMGKIGIRIAVAKSTGGAARRRVQVAARRGVRRCKGGGAGVKGRTGAAGEIDSSLDTHTTRRCTRVRPQIDADALLLLRFRPCVFFLDLSLVFHFARHKAFNTNTRNATIFTHSTPQSDMLQRQRATYRYRQQ